MQFAALLAQSGAFTAQQAELLSTAQFLFIFEQIIIFPLYYLPGLRHLLNGDGMSAKFPCSISWMTRRGLPRLVTLVLWNAGWFFMARAFVKDGDVDAMSSTDWVRAAFMLQMYATGFVTVVLTPMTGPDVAMGKADALHCYCAMIYVADHFIANEFILGVRLTSGFGTGFVFATLLCGVCQFLRAEDDHAARLLHATLLGGTGNKHSKRKRKTSSGAIGLDAFVYTLSLGFMFFENLLFLIFLFGLSSGVRVVAEQPPPAACAWYDAWCLLLS